MKNKIYKLGFILFIFACSCKQTEVAKQVHTIVEVQGHRGDRGNFPENTIPAFISAVKKGADVVELDVVISKDNKVVVSHEPFMSSKYVITPDGFAVTKEQEKSFNLHKMVYDSIRKFDTGSNGNKSFPEQRRIKTYKPLLSEVIDSVETYISTHNLKHIRYNIEIKSEKQEYGISQPMPEEFVKLVMQVINNKKIAKRVNIQSFDPDILNVMHVIYPKMKLAYLTDKPGIDRNLNELNFIPNIYSPNYKLVTTEFIDSLKSKKMKVIPWTVNNAKDIDAMLALKVDGIITDYPERVIEKLN
jgi:glycerophosphoryl diester phosphodiesterase